MAQEALLEESPPMASFKGKERPAQWEQTASKLMDERWLDVLMWRLKNRDSYLESRKRLGPSKKDWSGGAHKDKETKRRFRGRRRREAEKETAKAAAKKGGRAKGAKPPNSQAILAARCREKAPAQRMAVQFGIQFLILFAPPDLA